MLWGSRFVGIIIHLSLSFVSVCVSEIASVQLCLIILSCDYHAVNLMHDTPFVFCWPSVLVLPRLPPGCRKSWLKV